MFVNVSLVEAKWLVRLLEQHPHLGELREQLEDKIAAEGEPDEYVDDCFRMGIYL